MLTVKDQKANQIRRTKDMRSDTKIGAGLSNSD